jgi:hypothetical protein
MKQLFIFSADRRVNAWRGIIGITRFGAHDDATLLLSPNRRTNRQAQCRSILKQDPHERPSLKPPNHGAY